MENASNSESVCNMAKVNMGEWVPVHYSRRIDGRCLNDGRSLMGFLKGVGSVRTQFLTFLLLSLMALNVSSSSGPKDYYKTLGLQRSVNQRQIQKKYHKLSLEYHPDKNPKNKDKFLEIAEAYETLSDPKKRKSYDHRLEYGIPLDGMGEGGGGDGPTFFRADGAGGDGEFFFKMFSGGGPFGGHETHHTFQRRGGGGGGGGGQSLYSDSKDIVELTIPSEWESKVEQREYAVLVEFYKPSCPPCRHFKETYETLAKQWADIVPFLAVNCDRDQYQLCKKASFPSFPALALYGAINKPRHHQQGDNHNEEENNNEVHPTIYKTGAKTAEKVDKWLSESLPSLATLVTTVKQFDDWLMSVPEISHTVLFTGRPNIPPLLKLISYEFKNRMTIGVVRKTDTRLVNDLKERVPQSIEHLAFPSLLWIKDIEAIRKGDGSCPVHVDDVGRGIDTDKLTGGGMGGSECSDSDKVEWLEIKSFKKQVVSLSFSRIVAANQAHKGFFGSGGRYHELTKQQFNSGECNENDSQFCFIVFRYDSGSLPSTPRGKELYQQLKDIATKYKQDPMKIVWVAVPKQTKFALAFGLDQTPHECPKNPKPHECIKVIAFRGKRNRFKISNTTFETTNFGDSIHQFIDSVVSGGAQLDRKVDSKVNHLN